MSSIDPRQFLDAASREAGSGAFDPARPASNGGGFATRTANARLSPVVLAGLVRTLELAIVIVSGATLHHHYMLAAAPFGWTYLAAVAAATAAAAVSFQAAGLYTITAFRSLAKSVAKIAAAWTFVFVCAGLIVLILRTGDGPVLAWLGTWYVAGLAALLTERALVAGWMGRMARSGSFDRRTAIVGGGEPANEIIRALQASPESGIQIVGVFDDRDDARSPKMVGGVEKLGSVSDLVEYARTSPLDLVIFTLPISAEARLLQMLGKLWVLPIDIRLSAHASKLRLRPRSYSYIGSVPVLDVFDRPIADWDLVLKFAFDRIIGAILLILLAPVLLITALFVKLDSPGPVLFRQKRYGFNNELIEVLKFRSMYVDQSDAGASRLVTKGDPRVTGIGRILRKTSLDELPQLFNVLKGDLSLVGPRPHAIQAKAENRLYDQVVDGYFARHKVKPGITGWAQINGWRGETDTQEKIQRRVEHDLSYIENWSVFFDLYILAATPFALLKTENAY